MNEQKIRAGLFYLSVCVFFVGLPFILSIALGYKFDSSKLKFTKTGLIVIKTQPAGAAVYFNDKVLNEKTPVTINELLPGKYNIRIELASYYPWTEQIEVEAGRVSRFDKIILFPLRANVKQLNDERLSHFLVDEDEKKIYYVNQEEGSIYSTDFEGERHQIAGPFLPISPLARLKISPDKKKMLYFNKRQIGISPLKPYQERYPVDLPFIINYAGGPVVDVFWHSDSFHLIVVSDSKIEAMEAKPGSPAVELAELNRRTASVFYDLNSNSLFFIDYQKAEDGNFYNNLYKLDLSPRFDPFKELIKMKTNE